MAYSPDFILKAFRVTVGLEVHAELLTRTKMFSAAPNVYGGDPNTLVSEVDLGYPGTLPTVNAHALDLGVILASTLDMKIAETVSFDRKHYFYPDLPKGYQVTQQYNPLGVNGKLAVKGGDEPFTALITRIHLEEDTAKTSREGDFSLLDFNRAGSPLVEIVTEPCMSSGKQAMAFLVELKRILQFRRISAARMEEGSMRVDVNVSIAPVGVGGMGTRVEVKNINSIASVGKAVDHEVKRQAQLALANRPFVQETRRWDEASNQTVFMREKTDAIDYRYIAEPNLLPIPLPPNRVIAILNGAAPHPDAVREQLIAAQLNENEVDVLMSDHDLYAMVGFVASMNVPWRAAFQWVAVEAVGAAAKTGKPVNAALNRNVLTEIGKLAQTVLQGKLSARQGKEVAALLVKDGASLAKLLENPNYQVISDRGQIEKIAREEMINVEPMVATMLDRPDRIEKLVVGLVMKRTNGQADPSVASAVVKALTEERLKK